MKKIIVAGCRNFHDYDFIKKKLNKIKNYIDNFEIVSGNANGVDELGENFAIDNNINLTKFPANWEKYGKKAGHIRNKQMAEYADACICFWDYKSKGTKNMIENAKDYNLSLLIIKI